MEHVQVQKESTWYIQRFFKQENILDWASSLKNCSDCFMQDVHVQQDPLVCSTWPKSISAVPPQNLHSRCYVFCFALYVQLIRNLLHIVHHLQIKKNFCWNIWWKFWKKNYYVSQSTWDSKWSFCQVEAFRQSIIFSFWQKSFKPNSRFPGNLLDQNLSYWHWCRCQQEEVGKFLY